MDNDANLSLKILEAAGDGRVEELEELLKSATEEEINVKVCLFLHVLYAINAFHLYE